MREYIDSIEKAKKASPVGTEKTWGGKVYIKTEKGWKPKGKKEKTSEKEEDGKASSQTNDDQLKHFASKATDDQLTAALKDPDADPGLKKIAQEELDKRYPKQKESTATSEGKESIDEKLKQLEQDLISEINKKLSEMSGFKKITQTYVKSNGKTAVIKMKGENQYKATSPGLKMESKPYEDLNDFKKRVKEELEKQQSSPSKEVKVEKKKKEEKPVKSAAESEPLKEVEAIEFKKEEDLADFLKSRNSLDNIYDEKEREEIESIVEKSSVGLDKENVQAFKKEAEKTMKEKTNKGAFFYFLRRYGEGDDKKKREINAGLVEAGLAPIANGLNYHKYDGEEYYYVNSKNSQKAREALQDIYKEDRKALSLTQGEVKALESYISFDYEDMREFLVTGKGSKKIEKDVKNIKKAIDKNPLRRNMVLNRRLKFSGDNFNNLNTWLNAKVGDVVQDKSFCSFGMRHEVFFGSDFHITLLGKEGDPIMNAGNQAETEYLVQAGSSYKVLARGLNSIVVQLVK